MKLLFALFLLLQTSDADRMESALGKAGERTYSMHQNGQRIGTMTMKTRIEKTGDRKTAVFEDQLEVTMGGEKMQMSMKETAALAHLRLLSAKRAGKDMDWSVSVDGAKATMKVEGRQQTLEITETTVGEQGVLRMLCAAEQKAQASFKIDVLSMTGERLQRETLYRCVGKEAVEIAGKKVDAFKWEEKWEWKGTVNGVPTTSRASATYWVSPDGYLVRSTGPAGMEMVLEKK